MYHLHEDKRVAQSIAQIWAALDALIETTPYKAISVTSLAERAKVSKATFYRSFDCIDDVLKLQTDKCVDDMIAYVVKYRSDMGDSLRGEAIFFQAFFRYWMGNSRIIEQLIKTKNEYLLLEAFESTLQKSVEYFKIHIKIEDEMLKYFFAIRAAMLSVCLLCWIKEGKQTHPDEMPEIMMRIMRPAEPLIQK